MCNYKDRCVIQRKLVRFYVILLVSALNNRLHHQSIFVYNTRIFLAVIRGFTMLLYN